MRALASWGIPLLLIRQVLNRGTQDLPELLLDRRHRHLSVIPGVARALHATSLCAMGGGSADLSSYYYAAASPTVNVVSSGRGSLQQRRGGANGLDRGVLPD